MKEVKTQDSCHWEYYRMWCGGTCYMDGDPHFLMLPKWITHHLEEILNSPTWCAMLRHAVKADIYNLSAPFTWNMSFSAIATKACTSCEALNKYYKFLPTHCMKWFCITVFYIAGITKVSWQKGDPICLGLPNPIRLARTQTKGKNSTSSRNYKCKKQAVLCVHSCGKQQSHLWIPQWKAMLDAYNGGCSGWGGGGGPEERT